MSYYNDGASSVFEASNIEDHEDIIIKLRSGRDLTVTVNNTSMTFSTKELAQEMQFNLQFEIDFVKENHERDSTFRHAKRQKVISRTETKGYAKAFYKGEIITTDSLVVKKVTYIIEDVDGTRETKVFDWPIYNDQDKISVDSYIY